MLEILTKSGKKRTGIFKTKSGEINTPFFMPIATKGAVKNILPEELKKIGAEIILGNTYHLWLRPGDELIKNAGNLHRFMNWPGPILTDSGGFQVFSLGLRAQKNQGRSFVKLTENGVRFRDPVDGKEYFMTPEKSIEIQLNLGSDIIMVLDECTPFPCSWEDTKIAVERSIKWARRCKEYFDKEISKSKLQISNKIKNSKLKIQNSERPLLFAIVQGSNYEDLRKYCAEELIKIGFDGYAVGGMVPITEIGKVLEYTLPLLPEDKPRYIMGIGKPEEIFLAVNLGADMFDCVIPTREGRHGRLFVRNVETSNLDVSKIQKTPESGVSTTSNNFYETININNEKYKNDFAPVDSSCDCELCKNYSKAYLRYLFSVGEPLAMRLASIHNLKFYLDLMKNLRTTK